MIFAVQYNPSIVPSSTPHKTLLPTLHLLRALHTSPGVKRKGIYHSQWKCQGQIIYSYGKKRGEGQWWGYGFNNS